MTQTGMQMPANSNRRPYGAGFGQSDLLFSGCKGNYFVINMDLACPESFSRSPQKVK